MKSGFANEEDVKTIVRQMRDRISQVKRDRERKAEAAKAAEAAAEGEGHTKDVQHPIPAQVPQQQVLQQQASQHQQAQTPLGSQAHGVLAPAQAPASGPPPPVSGQVTVVANPGTAPQSTLPNQPIAAATQATNQVAPPVTGSQTVLVGGAAVVAPAAGAAGTAALGGGGVGGIAHQPTAPPLGTGATGVQQPQPQVPTALSTSFIEQPSGELAELLWAF